MTSGHGDHVSRTATRAVVFVKFILSLILYFGSNHDEVVLCAKMTLPKRAERAQVKSSWETFMSKDFLSVLVMTRAIALLAKRARATAERSEAVERCGGAADAYLVII